MDIANCARSVGLPTVEYIALNERRREGGYREESEWNRESVSISTYSHEIFTISDPI